MQIPGGSLLSGQGWVETGFRPTDVPTRARSLKSWMSGTVHWMFNRGLISLSDELDILVSRQVNDPDSVWSLVNKSRRASPRRARWIGRIPILRQAQDRFPRLASGAVFQAVGVARLRPKRTGQKKDWAPALGPHQSITLVGTLRRGDDGIPREKEASTGVNPVLSDALSRAGQAGARSLRLRTRRYASTLR